MNESTIASDEEAVSGEDVAAWIGLDWADQQHQIAEYSVATGKTTTYIVKTLLKTCKNGWMNCGLATAGPRLLW